MKIDGVVWFTQIPVSDSKTCFGIVYGKDDVTGERKAYIGSAMGFDEEADVLDIAACGSRISSEKIKEIYDFLNPTT